MLERVAGGQVLGGNFSVNLQPGELERIENGGEVPQGAINVALDLADMQITYIPKMPPVITEAAKLTVSGTVFSVDIPKAKVVLPSGTEIALSEGRFFIPELRQDPQQGELTFKAASTTPAVLQLLDHEPLGFITAVKMRPEDFGGSAVGDFSLTMPLMKELEFKDIKLNGMTRLDDAIATNVAGKLNRWAGHWLFWTKPPPPSPSIAASSSYSTRFTGAGHAAEALPATPKLATITMSAR